MAAGLVADPPAPVTDPAPAGAKWFDAFDEPTKAYIGARGLADKDPAAAFLEAAKAHQEAQAYIGVPKEQLLRLPKADAPPEEWDAVYERLGYSTKADDYKLEGLKFADGSDVEDSFRDFVRLQAKANHLSPAATAKLAQETIAFLESQETAQTSEQAIAAARAAEQLRNSWGPNYQANMVIADRAYAALMAAAGFTQEQMTASMQSLKDANGTEGTMQLLLALGQRISEDTFVSGGRVPGNANAMIATREQASARKAELMGDAEYAKRLLAGGVAETREMQQLDMRIAGYDERGEPLA